MVPIQSWRRTSSIGHYEGQTLVVDATNFRRETHNLDSSERLHVVERFTRIEAKTLRYRVTVEDPDTWPTPVDRRMAVQVDRCRAVQRRVSQGQLRDRKLPPRRACRRTTDPSRALDEAAASFAETLDGQIRR
jgi:hypothetical protein